MKIDFYILNESDKQKSLVFACQLIEKIYTERKIYVHMPSLDAVKHFDHLLWIYKEDSFIPHDIYQGNDPMNAPIQIGHEANVGMKKATLINFQDNVPDFYQQFDHVIEIVYSDPLVQQLARERYKKYRDGGNELNTFKENNL
jgi:DNA polymerase-3 subunit chi